MIDLESGHLATIKITLNSDMIHEWMLKPLDKSWRTVVRELKSCFSVEISLNLLLINYLLRVEDVDFHMEIYGRQLLNQMIKIHMNSKKKLISHVFW